MKTIVYLLTAILVLTVCSCHPKKISDIGKSQPGSFERIEVGDPATVAASLDMDDAGDWVCTIEANQLRRDGGGPVIPVREFQAVHKTELRIKSDMSGSYKRWLDTEVKQQKTFTPGFFTVFDIIDESGQPRATLENGDSFAQVLFFDSKGQLRIKLAITNLLNAWQEAQPEIVFYDETGKEITD